MPSLLRNEIATYDDGADSAEGSNALARAVVELDLDLVLLGLPVC